MSQNHSTLCAAETRHETVIKRSLFMTVGFKAMHNIAESGFLPVTEDK